MPTIKTTRPYGNENLANPAGGKVEKGRLGWLNLSAQITREGLIYVVLMVLLGGAAFNTGLNLLYLVLALLMVLFVSAGVMSHSNMAGLRVRRYYPREFHAGEQVTGQIELDNRKRLRASYGLRVEEEIVGPVDDARSMRYRFTSYTPVIAPRSRKRIDIGLNLPRRGEYALTQIHVITRYPFGLIERGRVSRLAERLLVFPQLIPVDQLGGEARRLLDEEETRRKGPGTQLHEIRDYQPDDPARHIHWKLTAKTGELKVREFEHEQGRSYLLMLDLRVPQDPSPNQEARFEKAVSMTASLARALIDEQTEVGVWTTAGHVLPSNGRGHLRRIYRSLSRVSMGAMDEPAKMPSGLDPSHVKIWIQYQDSSQWGRKIRPPRDAYVIAVGQVMPEGMRSPAI